MFRCFAPKALDIPSARSRDERQPALQSTDIEVGWGRGHFLELYYCAICQRSLAAKSCDYGVDLETIACGV